MLFIDNFVGRWCEQRCSPVHLNLVNLVFIFLILYHLNLVITQEPISKKVSFLTYNLIYHFIFEGCSKWIMYICFINAFEIHTKNDILTLFITLNHYRDDPIRLTNNKYQTYIYHVVNTLLYQLEVLNSLGHGGCGCPASPQPPHG
jgi:hypothetical protein